MSARIDIKRFADLERALGEELPEIVAEMVASMETAIARIEAAMTVPDLAEAARAAHLCRNDALMVGAGELLSGLGSLETAARAGSASAASEALGAVRQAWPPTRSELQRAFPPTTNQ